MPIIVWIAIRWAELSPVHNEPAFCMLFVLMMGLVHALRTLMAIVLLMLVLVHIWALSISRGHASVVWLNLSLVVIHINWSLILRLVNIILLRVYLLTSIMHILGDSPVLDFVVQLISLVYNWDVIVSKHVYSFAIRLTSPSSSNSCTTSRSMMDLMIWFILVRVIIMRVILISKLILEKIRLIILESSRLVWLSTILNDRIIILWRIIVIHRSIWLLKLSLFNLRMKEWLSLVMCRHNLIYVKLIIIASIHFIR